MLKSCALRTRDKGCREHKLEIRKDEVSNALTLVAKDFLVISDENESKGSDIMTNINEVNATPFEGKPFTYVSLFSGIGGFEQALNKLGGTCVMASEIDKFANQSYELLYGHKTVGDITKVEAQDVPDHNVLVGGFPCQAFSVAGKRGGFDDARGTLFFEIARLAKVKQPRAMLLENVKGLVGHDKGKTLDTIVTTLNDIGYTVDFNVLNSKYFGVPQNRERIFIIAMRDDLVESAEWAIEGTNVVAKGKRRIAGLPGVKTFNFAWPEQTEVATRLRDVLEPAVDERYYLSEEKTAKLVAQLCDDGKELPAHFPTSNSLNNTIRTGGKGSLTAKHNYDHIAIVNDRGKLRNIPCSTALDANYFKGLDNHAQRTHVLSAEYRIRKLTPLECFRLQGFPDSAYEALSANGVSNTQLYKQAGNAVTVNVIDAIGRRLLPLIINK